MLLDKLNWTRGTLNGGNLFALLGLANLLGFGASLFMEQDNYEARFAHVSDGKMFKPFASWFGSDKLSHIVWTTPFLVCGGIYLNKCVGPLIATKFFAIAAVSSYVS